MKKLLTIAMIGVLATSLNAAYASGQTVSTLDTKASSTKTAKALPDVKLPFTFTCQHCGLKITIKTVADWSKDCSMCACGVTNLGCYKPPKTSSKPADKPAIKPTDPPAPATPSK